MPNFQISDLPLATTPLDLTETFFEVQTIEGGVDVSRRVSGDNLTFGVGSLDDLSDVTLTAPVEGSVLFKSAGDWINSDLILITSDGQVQLFDAQFAQARHLSMVTTTAGISLIPGGAGGDTVLNYFDETATVLFGNINMALGRARWSIFQNSVPFEFRSRDTGGIFRTNLEIHPDDGVIQRFLGVDMARTVIAGSGGLEVNNTVTGAGFERVLTTADLGGAVSFPIDAADNEQIRWGTGQDMLQFFDGTDMQFNAIDGVDFRFLGGTAGAETMLSLISNGAMEASFNGAEKLATTLIGIDVRGNLNNDPEASGLQDTTIALLNLNGLQAGQITYAGTGDLRIINEVHGDDVVLIAEDNAGVARELVRGNPNDTTRLHFAGTFVASTTNQGMDVRATGANINAVVQIIGSGTGDAGVNFNELAVGTQLQIKWDQGLQEASFRLSVAGDNFRFFEASSGDVLLEMTQGGSVDSYFDGRLVTQTINISGTDDALESTRLRLTSSIDASLSSTLHAFQVGSTAGLNVIMDINEIMARNNGVATELLLNADGGSVFLGASTGTRININDGANIALMVVNENGIIVRANADVALFHNNVEVARSDSLANGGMEVNNTLTGAGFERVLTTADLPVAFLATSRTNSTVLSTVTPVSYLSLAAVPIGDYWMQASIEIAASAAEDDLDVRVLVGTGAQGTVNANVMTSSTGSGAAQNEQMDLLDTDITVETNGSDNITISGFLRVTTLGTVDLQLSKDADVATDITVRRGLLALTEV